MKKILVVSILLLVAVFVQKHYPKNSILSYSTENCGMGCMKLIVSSYNQMTGNGLVDITHTQPRAHVQFTVTNGQANLVTYDFDQKPDRAKEVFDLLKPNHHFQESVKILKQVRL